MPNPPRQLPLELPPTGSWCQRWRDRRPRWRHRSEGGFDAAAYEVAPVADGAARAYVERHHYAGTYIASRLRYGLWARGGLLVGVAVLSVPVRRAVLARAFWGSSRTRLCGHFALRGPRVRREIDITAIGALVVDTWSGL